MGVGQIHTTQGRLYTVLWKGDLAILDIVSDEPKIPLSIQNVTKNIVQTSVKARELAGDSSVFVMAYDPSNKTSITKFSSVNAELRSCLIGRPVILSPKEAGIIRFDEVAPTISVAFFIAGKTKDELHELTKKALYPPSKEAKKKMFRIASHGLIV